MLHKRTLQDMSVVKKLVVGFGSLLVVVLILAGAGFYALHISGESANRTSRIGSLFDLTTFAREANFTYLLTNDGQYVEKHQQYMHDFESALAQLQSDVASGVWPASDRAAIEALKQRLQSYRQMRERASSKEEVIASNELLSKLQASTNELYYFEEARASERQLRSDLILTVISSLAVLIGVLSVLIISRQIIIPLRNAVRAVQQVADGDLSQDLHSDRKDELGALQNGLHAMSQNLRRVVGQISSSALQLAASASQLASVTSQTRAGIDSQRSETDMVATAMNEMSATVQEVARHSEDAASAARNANIEASKALDISHSAISNIEVLSTGILASALSMERLQQESNRIGGILDVIKAVAEQTNLLALNAAIEAARAGEAGRGFAVVADEVRNLAQRTQQSSSEIEQLITELQDIANESSATMQASVEQTHASVAGVRDAGAVLDVITHQISNIQQMNELIATATEEQSAVSEEINMSVTRVRGAAEESATASAEIASATIDLEKLSRELTALIGRFKV